jgi:hypothetical protein
VTYLRFKDPTHAKRTRGCTRGWVILFENLPTGGFGAVYFECNGAPIHGLINENILVSFPHHEVHIARLKKEIAAAPND